MALPSFADLGKKARGVFNQGYNFGFLKLETTTTSGSTEFRSNSSHNQATGKFFGGLDVKYKLNQYGITLVEKWNTDNSLGTEITVEDQFIKGSRLIFDSQFSPALGKRSGKIKAEYDDQNVHVNSDVTLDLGGPVVTTSVVTGQKGWLLGLQAQFDSAQRKLAHHGLVLGYTTSNYALTTHVHDSAEFGGSIYHRVNGDTELAANMSWTNADKSARLGVAARYQVDKDLVVRAKLSSTSQIGLAFTQSLKSGLKLTVSSLINLQNLNEGGHKFGVGLEYEPNSA